MSLKQFFQNKYHDLVLKKCLNLRVAHTDCYIELMDQGESICMLSTLYENHKGLPQAFVEEVEALEAKGLCIDIQKGEVLIARKYDFRSMTPGFFGIHMAQFFSEIQRHRKDIDGFKDKEYAPIKRK